MRNMCEKHTGSQKATAGFEPGGAWLGIVSLTSAAAPRLCRRGAWPECRTAIRRQYARVGAHTVLTHTRNDLREWQDFVSGGYFETKSRSECCINAYSFVRPAMFHVRTGQGYMPSQAHKSSKKKEIHVHS